MFQLALAIGLVVLGALAGGVVGWVARRDDTRAYLASRERYWQRRLEEALGELESAAQLVPAAPAAVVHVHMAAPVSTHQMPRVIDAQVIPALTSGEVA